ncbi:RagB/SusD family nutrient uptake outer membrane protein [Aridibaculum aurantiacum]|uniref:RagB/SusD family nutrient uptake outer membrane protein n=1 Tax=Aridibaculum aurantiacum TaxID=2810307 RepID=UPI001A978F74|nr:RagB/SusD family nutrient uptake outer membrane protein [Aridibaculum aurantiacum]
MKQRLWLLLVPVTLFACKKNFLQDGSTTEGAITEEQVWGNDSYTRGFINNAYFHVPSGFDMDGDGAMLASGSDEAVNSNLNSSINIFNNGTWAPVRTVNNIYADMYEGLRKVNLFLEKVPTAVLIPTAELTTMTPADTGYAAQLNRLRGEAFFLRGMFFFELVKRYGGVPLVTRVLSPNENLNLPRNSFEECVAQVVKDCDSAIAHLPTWTQSWNTQNRGRATKTAALALKARMLLYAASPLFNTTNDASKWQAAANVAKAVIDSNKHSLMTNYTNIFNFGAAQYNNEVIFATQALNRNDIEINNAPIGYDGAKGRTNPTQEFVDAFEMTNGRSISDAASGYNPNNPYNQRDPRLALTVNFNGRSFKGRAVETFVGGADGLDKNVNATKTGYYMRKFLSEAATWNQVSNTNARRPWVVLRYAEVLLNYAEALNEAQGPVADVYKYVNMVRQRSGVGMPALPAGLNKEQMRARIHNERRVELCFEGHRFFDVRRWKLADVFFNRSVSGMRITPNTNGTFNYTRFTVESRVFFEKHYLFPFSQNDMNRQPALVQNPGY